MKVEKQCKNCEVTKPLSGFYKHRQMADGRLNICKKCCKDRMRARYHEKVKDPEWVEKERERGREKYHRLGYKDKYKTRPEDTTAYRINWPEKYEAVKASQNIPCPEDHHRHHWSYKEEHQTDVILLPYQDHYLLHRYISYDDVLYLYRDPDGEILPTKDSHLELLEKIKSEL